MRLPGSCITQLKTQRPSRTVTRGKKRRTPHPETLRGNRVLDGAASGGEGSKNRHQLDSIRTPQGPCTTHTSSGSVHDAHIVRVRARRTHRQGEEAGEAACQAPSPKRQALLSPLYGIDSLSSGGRENMAKHARRTTNPNH